MWRINEHGVFPKFKIECIYCYSEMQPWVGKPLKPFAIDKSQPDVKESYAVDVHVRCPKCYFNEVFGVAMLPSDHADVMKLT
jgi:hypothetical protein